MVLGDVTGCPLMLLGTPLRLVAEAA